MHISPAVPDGFNLEGKLGRTPPGSLALDTSGLNEVSHPAGIVGGGRVDRSLRFVAETVGTIRFGRLFKLSLLAMVAAGASHALSSLTGWMVFGRLYGASMAVALVFSMGAALTEVLRDKGEDSGVAAGKSGNHPGRLFTLG